MGKINSTNQSQAAPASSKQSKSQPPAVFSPQPPFVVPKSRKIQKLEEDLKEVEKKKKAIEASRQQKISELAEETRKNEDRYRILIGTAILIEIEKGNLSWEGWLKPILKGALTEQDDREFFGLTDPQLPEDSSPKKLSEEELAQEEEIREGLDAAEEIEAGEGM